MESIMEPGVILLTLSAYGLASFLWWRERSPNYLIGLMAGHVGVLFSPLWQALYGFAYDGSFHPLYTLLGHPLPRVVFIAGWAIMLPPLAIFYLFRHRFWFAGYTIGL